jgi:hypothetical protein
MNFGVRWFATDEGPRRDFVTRLIDPCGVESLFATGRRHIPRPRAQIGHAGYRTRTLLLNRYVDPVATGNPTACAETPALSSIRPQTP